MKCTLVFACLVAFVVLADARVFLFIDTFDDPQPPTILIAANGGDTSAPYDWWSPYFDGSTGGGDPVATFFATANAVGGQRDSILGYDSSTPTSSVAIISIVGDAASVAFPLKYVGGAYFQWDGIDDNSSGTAFPGAVLNTLPGLGFGEPDSTDDQTIDFTYGGRAAGFFIEITADHDVFYFIDAVDTAGNPNTMEFTVEITNEDSVVQFFFRFDDVNWSDQTFDFTDVCAFEVRVFTFSEGVLAGADNAIDTEFRFLRIFGYEVSGTVVTDCLCDRTTDITPVIGELMNLFFSTNLAVVIDTAVTDVNGDYLFNDQTLLLTGNSYRVCLDDLAQDICPTTSNCLDFNLVNLIDVIDLDFFVTSPSTLRIPDDATVDCGGCTDPSCLGFAFADGCGSGSVQINDFTDSITSDGCTVTISRTWVDPESLASGIQTITVVDNDSPVIFQTAVDVTQTCDITSTYTNWINTQAGADATDCSTFSWSASPNTSPFQCDFETVTFTATDVCGHSAVTTATYTVTDFIDPIWNPLASPLSVECDLKTNSNTGSMNTWRNTFGGAIASDNCSSNGALVFSDNFVSISPSCADSTTVNFSVIDTCGNSAITTATFSIADTTPPTITQQPADLSIDCGVNGGTQNSLDNWLLIRGGAQATDQCIANDNNLAWSNNFSGSLGTCSDSGVVTFTVLDNCGFSSSATASYTLSDNSPPTFTSTASSINSQCDGLGNNSDFNTWIADNAGATATDNCGSVSFTNDNTGPPVNCGDSVTVTFTATDSCSLLSITTTASFTIIDNAPPVFTVLPQDSSSECSPSSSSEFTSWLNASAFSAISDVCSSTGTFISNDFVGTTLNPGCLVTQSVRFFANDPCGNISGAQTAVFTISDTIPPTISPEASSVTVECNLQTNQADYQNFLSTNGGASATDTCGNVSFTNDGTSIQSGCNNSVDVTFTVNDGCGQTDITTASFTIVDTTFPVLVSPAADMSVECNGSGNNNDLTNWLNSNGGASATDTCGGVSFTNDFVALSGGCTSTAFVTFTGCDSCGQCVSSSATFTVIDNSSPQINPQAAGTTVECDPTSNDNAFDTFVANRGGAQASDICEDDSNLIWSSSFAASPFGCDSEVVTFTVSDSCGRTASTTATFTILDTVSPTITVPAASVSFECDGAGNSVDYNNFISTRSGADAVDVCAFSLVWINNAPLNGPVGCGTQAVTFTVEDECLNSSSTTATFTIIDSFGPTISTPASNQSVQCTDTNSNLTVLETWLSTQGGAFGSDSCYASDFIWVNNFSNLNFDGCTEFADVTFTATDPCGSFSTTSATFSIIDTVSPVFTEVATNAVFECSDIDNPNDINNYLALNGNSVATDLCSGVSFTNDFVSGPLECGPSVPVTFTATDACGNFASTTGSISIDDSVAPSFSFFPEDAVLGCDQDIDPATAGSPIVFDACDADITATFTDVDFKEPDEGFCPGDLITTRTWFIVDDCGNTHQRDQIITTVFALTSGPCTPTQCPPCELDQCCEIVPDQIQCNAVPCNVVSCTTVPCDAVPCLPNVDCQDFDYTDDDDNSLTPIPEPSFQPVPPCEPVYIYVFDDDETNVNGPGNPVPEFESSSSASSLKVSAFMALTIAILSLLF